MRQRLISSMEWENDVGTEVIRILFVATRQRGLLICQTQPSQLNTNHTTPAYYAALSEHKGSDTKANPLLVNCRCLYIYLKWQLQYSP